MFVYLLFNVTFNDNSVILCDGTEMFRRTEDKLDIRSGSHAIDISKGSLTCPSNHRHGANPFTGIPRNRPISVGFYDAQGFVALNGGVLMANKSIKPQPDPFFNIRIRHCSKTITLLFGELFLNRK